MLPHLELRLCPAFGFSIFMKTVISSTCLRHHNLHTSELLKLGIPRWTLATNGGFQPAIILKYCRNSNKGGHKLVNRHMGNYKALNP